MIHFPRSSRTKNTRKQSFVKVSASAVIVIVLLFLLIPQIWPEKLWADDLKEYIYMDGKLVAVETGADTCGSLSISATSKSFAASAGTGSVGVTAVADCTWTASSNVSWVTVTSGAGGIGNGTMNYSVGVNNGDERSGTITIAGKTFYVYQALSCYGRIQSCMDEINCAATCEANMPPNCLSAGGICMDWYNGCVASCQADAQYTCNSLCQ